MRRAVLTLSGTVTGLVALFSYKTHVPGATPVADPSTPAAHVTSAPAKTASPDASSSRTPAKKATPKASKTSAAPTTTQRTTPTAAKTTPKPAPTPTKAAPTTAPPKPSGTFEGSDVNTQYGPVQVEITVSDGKITAASDVQPPSDSRAAKAVTQLNSEVLQAQSANIQAVSGATYTSEGYIQSLQQAINKAGL